MRTHAEKNNPELLYVEGEDEASEENEKEIFPIEEYDLSSSPNDFNIMTLGSFIDYGSIIIPGFQRNYVWNIKKASKLIESLLLGLPVPPLFLYEASRNKIYVIDGQQRLMTVYYFLKGRFPKVEKRPEIRNIIVENGVIPDDIFYNDDYFIEFKLSLPGNTKDNNSMFHGLSYEELDDYDYKRQFDMRTIRNIIVKQHLPKDDDSSIYEIFNRLNSGGVNLTTQEIRNGLYHSEFYKMLDKLNLNQQWRKFLHRPYLDLYFKDFELLVRIFAFLINKERYKPSLRKFLNLLSKQALSFDRIEISYLETLFNKFMSLSEQLPDDTFFNKKSGRFKVFLFESVFYATCIRAYKNRTLPKNNLNYEKIAELSSNQGFKKASQAGTTSLKNVTQRFKIADTIINS